MEEAVAAVGRPVKVAVGFNSCVDCVVDGPQLVSRLMVRKPLSDIERVDRIRLHTVEELVSTFLFFCEKGVAAERFMDRQLYMELVKAAKEIPSTLSAGGNAALMANNMRSALTVDTMLGGPVGKTLPTLLDQELKFAGGVEDDETHFILEYQRGQHCAAGSSIVSPRANRFIVHADDKSSRFIGMHELLQSRLPEFQPDALVATGFHLLEERSQEERELILAQFRAGVSEYARTAEQQQQLLVHWELASVGSDQFLAFLYYQMSGLFNSLGLNEQELGHLYVALGGPDDGDNSGGSRSLTRRDFENPTVDNVLLALERVFDRAHKSLARIHLHSLHFHVVAFRRNGPWAFDSSTSVLSGSRAATEAACSIDGRQPTGDTVFDPTVALETRTSGLVVFHVAPVLVCRRPTRTVGLGDVISSTALIKDLEKI